MQERHAALELGQPSWLRDAQVAYITALATERDMKEQVFSQDFSKELPERQEMTIEDWGRRLEVRLRNNGVTFNTMNLPEYRLDRAELSTLLKLYRDGTTVETSVFLPFYQLACVYPDILRFYQESELQNEIDLSECGTIPPNCPASENYDFAYEFYALNAGAGLEQWTRVQGYWTLTGYQPVLGLVGGDTFRKLYIVADWSECGPINIKRVEVRMVAASGNQVSGFNYFLEDDQANVMQFEVGDFTQSQYLFVYEGDALTDKIAVFIISPDDEATWTVDYIRVETDTELTCGPTGLHCTETP